MRSFQHPRTLAPVPGDVVALLRRVDLAAGGEARYVDQLATLRQATDTSALSCR